jgi:hypothetical protein
MGMGDALLFEGQNVKVAVTDDGEARGQPRLMDLSRDMGCDAEGVIDGQGPLRENYKSCDRR